MLFWDSLSSLITLTCYFTCHRAGSQLAKNQIFSRKIAFEFVAVLFGCPVPSSTQKVELIITIAVVPKQRTVYGTLTT